jgi:hypothetical protein
MESTQNNQTFMKEMFHKHTEILMKRYNDIYENVTTSINPKQKESTFNYDDTHNI